MEKAVKGVTLQLPGLGSKIMVLSLAGCTIPPNTANHIPCLLVIITLEENIHNVEIQVQRQIAVKSV